MNLLSPNNLLMTIVLVFLTIVLAIIVIPFLIIVAICCLFSYIVMGISSVVFFNNHKKRRHDGIYEGPYRNQPQDNATSPVVHDDGSIECEVISVQTVEKDENTPDALH